MEGHRASQRIPQSQEHRRYHAQRVSDQRGDHQNPPLLYSKAGLAGAIPNFEPERLAGMEDVAGNKCYRLEGTTSDAYAQTGKKVDARNVTVWIDSTSYLVRKILEDRPAVPGTLNRITTTFNPQANPKLNDDSFQFAPPK